MKKHARASMLEAGTGDVRSIVERFAAIATDG
jgi:hypothetical protein